MSIKHYNTVTW